MRYRHMSEKQLLVYGARIRLGWFRKAEELGSVVDACKYYGVPRRTYYYWYKRWLASGKDLVSLYDQPRTPKSHSRDADEELVSLIVQLRLGLGYGEDALAFVLQRDYGVTVSHHGVGNVLKRAGLLKKRRRRLRTRRQLSSYPYTPGERGQLDVKHWKRVAYQYSLVDCATRIKYKRLYPGYDPATTVDFLRLPCRFFTPAFTFTEIQTDNGTEFTYDNFPQVKPDTRSAVEVWLAAQGIIHGRIPAHSPHLNGRVERSHGIDKARYKLLTSNAYTKAELQRFLVDDCLDYNFYRPHSSLGMKTPVEYLQSLAGFEHATVNISVLDV